MRELILECNDITNNIKKLINSQNLIFNENIDVKKILFTIRIKIKKLITKIKEIKNRFLIKIIDTEKILNDYKDKKFDYTKTVNIHLFAIKGFDILTKTFEEDISIIKKENKFIRADKYEKFFLKDSTKLAVRNKTLVDEAFTIMKSIKKVLKYFDYLIEDLKEIINEKSQEEKIEKNKVTNILGNINALSGVFTKCLAVILIDCVKIIKA